MWPHKDALGGLGPLRSAHGQDARHPGLVYFTVVLTPVRNSTRATARVLEEICCWGERLSDACACCHSARFLEEVRAAGAGQLAGRGAGAGWLAGWLAGRPSSPEPSGSHKRPSSNRKEIEKK